MANTGTYFILEARLNYIRHFFRVIRRMKDVASCLVLVWSHASFRDTLSIHYSVATCVHGISVNPRSTFVCSSIMFATELRPRNTEKRSTLTTPYVSCRGSHTETQLRSFHCGSFRETARQDVEFLAGYARLLQPSGFSLSCGLTICSWSNAAEKRDVCGLSGR